MSHDGFSVERERLGTYTEDLARLLTRADTLQDSKEELFKQDYVYWSIGKLASNLAVVGADAAAIRLTQRLLDETGSDEDGRLSAWSSLAENGVKAADQHLRDAMGLTRDQNGDTVLGEHIDMQDGRTFYRLLALYEFGDPSVLSYLHEFIESRDETSMQHAARLAVKLYDAGDASAYELMLRSAGRSRDHILATFTEPEIEASDASDFRHIMQAVAGALVPKQSEMEREYAQTDIALQYFAQRMLQEGDIARADEVQSLMLSKFANAWVNAQRFETGNDPDGTYLAAVSDYLEIYSEEAGGHVTELTHALVRGGQEDVIKLYKDALYDPAVDPNEVSALDVAEMLVALHHAGDTDAAHRLVELVKDPDDTWIVISSLEEMGHTYAATDLARRDFARRRDYESGLRLLHLEYDEDAMHAVQNGSNVYDTETVRIVNSRARHLGLLAARIVEIEAIR